MIERLKNRRVIIGIFFAAVFIWGISMVGSYSANSDDTYNRTFGYNVYNQVAITFGFTPAVCHGWCALPAGDHAVTHGPLFEFLLVVIEQLAHLHDSSQVYLMRHVFTFGLFFVGLIFFYKLCQRYFRNWKLSLLGTAFLVLSPRIFAASIYNLTDTGTLVSFIIASWSLFYFLEKKSYERGFLHACICGLAVAVRVTNVLVVAMTLVFVVIEVWYSKQWKRPGYISLWFLIIFALVTFMCWPYLWLAPFSNFFYAVTHTSGLHEQGISAYFWGSMMTSNSVPWTYNLVLITITTPLLYIIFALLGLAATLRLLGKNIFKHHFLLYCTVWLGVPLIMAMFLHPTQYGGWRHFYFVYPALVIFALVGFSHLWAFLQPRSLSRSLVILTLVMLCCIGTEMIVCGPFNFMYFNVLTSPGHCYEFAPDFLNLVYYPAFKYVLRTDPRPSLTIVLSNSAGLKTALSLSPEERNRLHLVATSSKANYFFADYLTLKDQGFCTIIANSSFFTQFSLQQKPIIDIFKLH